MAPTWSVTSSLLILPVAVMIAVGRNLTCIGVQWFSVTLIYLNSTLNPILHRWKIQGVRESENEIIKQYSPLVANSYQNWAALCKLTSSKNATYISNRRARAAESPYIRRQDTQGILARSRARPFRHCLELMPGTSQLQVITFGTPYVEPPSLKYCLRPMQLPHKSVINVVNQPE